MSTNEALRALAEAATPGPWGATWMPTFTEPMGEHRIDSQSGWVASGLTTQDAKYIATATPERVIELLDEVRDLRLTDSQKKNALENIYAKCHPAEDSVPGTHDELCNRTLLGVKALEQQNAALVATLTWFSSNREGSYNDWQQEQMNIEDAALASVEEGEVCVRCGCEIDPDVCWCGDEISRHSQSDNHSPCPMGCNCTRLASVKGGEA